MLLDAINRHPLPALNLLDRSVFLANLRFVHGLILASEPLIEEVLQRDMGNVLRDFYEQKLDDEAGHADWLEADLLRLGENPGLEWAAAQVAGTQYYLVRHGPPEALLGYMAALECRPMPLDTVSMLEDVYGPLRTLRYHAEHDREHGAELLEFIGKPSEIILRNAELTASMLEWALSGLVRKEAA